MISPRGKLVSSRLHGCGLDPYDIYRLNEYASSFLFFSFPICRLFVEGTLKMRGNLSLIKLL